MNWKSEIKNKMESYSEPAPEGLWSDIDAALGSQRKKRTPIIILGSAGALLAAAAVVAAVFFAGLRKPSDAGQPDIFADNGPGISTTDSSRAVLPANQATASGTDSNATVLPMTEVEDFPIDAVPSASGSRLLAETLRPDHSAETLETGHPQNPDKTAADNITTIVSPEVSASGKTGGPDSNIGTQNNFSEDRQETVQTIEPQEFPRDIFAEIPPARTRREPKAKRFNIALESNGGLPSGSSANGYSMSFTSPSAAAEVNPMRGIMMMNWARDISTDYDYRFPVSIGINLGYDITRSWSIETGIKWTMLTTAIRSGSEDNYSRESDRLHYIGVPLTVKANIWQNRYLAVYAGAGGMLQKMVSGKKQARYYFGGVETSIETSRLKEKQLQWSVNATAGLQLRCTDYFGIYIEPGIIYYFDNGSSIRNIYKARPFNFNLSLGLRFSL